MYTLEKYADSLFENVPDSKEARELHDEILSDMKSRYADCIESGMTPERAYAAVIGTMGDMSGLIGQLCVDNYTAYPGKADEGKYDYLFTKENYKTIKKTINAVLWIFVTIVFLLLIGFTDFSLPWLVFLAGAAVSEMINLAFAIARNEKKGDTPQTRVKILKKIKKHISAVMWLGIIIVFFVLIEAGFDMAFAVFLLGATAQTVLEAVMKIQINRFSRGENTL